MINNEEGQSLSDSHHRHETQVYDDLSTFMQLFKKQLSSIEEVIFIHQKEISIDVPQQRLKDISRTIESFIRKYNRTSGLQRIQSRTYQRFICRLFETIALYQLKYQGNNTSQGNIMQSTLVELETIVKENESIHDFGRLMKANRIVVEKFSSFQFVENGFSPKKEQSVMNATSKRPILLEKMETKMIKLKGFPKVKREEGSQDNGGESQEEQFDQQYPKSATVSEKRIHYLPITQSIGSELQKRFELYKGLDLDFPSFKSSYFSAKSNPDQFYREYLERNIFINRLMKVYNDDFLLFQKKKLFRNHRRTISNKQPNGHTLEKDSKSTQSQILQSQKSSQKDKGEKRIAFIHNENFQQDKQEEPQPQKPCYKLNNVYLTFGKKPIKTLKNTRHYPNITPNILKNKQQLQNIYFNQSLCSPKDLTITKSIDFQLSQIKVISNMRGAQRLRTSPDRQKQYESCKHQQLNNVIKSLKEIQYPLRQPGKSRYLQLDCTSKKETSLNRVILTGSMNVKNVKLSKLNQDKHKNILF